MKDCFPTASAKAVKLLDRLLKLDVMERLNAYEALKDPYLSKYHDPDDEPICVPAFDFSFENKFREQFDKKVCYLKISSCLTLRRRLVV